MFRFGVLPDETSPNLNSSENSRFIIVKTTIRRFSMERTSFHTKWCNSLLSMVYELRYDVKVRASTSPYWWQSTRNTVVLLIFIGILRDGVQTMRLSWVWRSRSENWCCGEYFYDICMLADCAKPVPFHSFVEYSTKHPIFNVSFPIPHSQEARLWMKGMEWLAMTCSRQCLWV